MSFTTKADAQQRAANEQFERESRIGLDAIYQKYSMLHRTIATDKMIVDLVSQYMGERTAPDIATFEMMLENNPNCGLPVKTVEAQRAELIEEICALLRSPSGDGRGGKYSDMDLKTYRRNVLSYQSKEWLEQRKAQILEAQTFAKQSPEAIKAQLRAQRQQEAKDGVLTAEYTREKLLSSTNLLKFCIRNWNVSAVNDRLNGRG